MDLRRQRIENEWTILGGMAAANSHRLSAPERSPDEFSIVLEETTSPISRNHQIELVSQHRLRISFPRFFPAAPIEAYLNRPVFHPNVHPFTGFVCLWSRFSRADTVVEALCQLQRILAYSVFSGSTDDVMQPDALAWATNANRGLALPLPFTPLAKPPSWPEERDARNAPLRRRLSPIEFS